MNEALVALIIVIGAMVLIPIILKTFAKAYQDFDFKRQLEGKIPERKYHGDNPPIEISEDYGSNGNTNQQMYKESCDAELRMRGMQNIIGPK